MKKKTIKKIVNLCWNLVFVYLLFVMIIIKDDAKKNPELYALVEERPERPSGNTPLNKLVPGWQYKASTFEECKPMVHWMDVYNKWLKPLAWVILILVLANISLRINWSKVRKISEKIEDD